MRRLGARGDQKYERIGMMRGETRYTIQCPGLYDLRRGFG